MIERFKKSRKVVEEVEKERERENLLKQEQRRLKEEDLMKLRARQKRQELKRKIDIVNKEKKDNELREEVRRREQILIDARYDMRVKSNFEKISFTKDVQSWLKEGYSTSKAAKKKLRLDHSPGVEERLAKLASKDFAFGKN
jgi:hypothetical protein